MRGNIFNIQKYSIHDGPGIRTTVFLKGCPLSCAWCHNPEGINPDIELIYYDDRCIRCWDCVRACPENALKVGTTELIIDRKKCTACGSCEEACDYRAIMLAGTESTIDEIVKEVLKDKVFYDNSGGGVTISGGEPLLQWSFTRELIVALKASGLNVAVDTSGFAPWEHIEEILPYTDLFLYDLKLVDPKKHMVYIGVDNELILENLKKLSDCAAPIVLRIPIVRGVNDSKSDLEDFLKIVGRLNLKQINLLKYHSMGKEKYPRLNEDYRMEGTEVPDPEVIERMRDELKLLGYEVIIGG